MLNAWRSDLNSAARGLLKNRAYSVFTIICLALGIGATTAVFTVVNAFLLKPLPFEDPSRLILIWTTVQGADKDSRYFVKPESFLELQRISEGFQLAAAQQADFNISLEAEPRRVAGVHASYNLFKLLGIPLLSGRFFSEQEERLEEKVCVVSEQFWRDELGSPSDLAQQKLHLEGEEFLIVGVAPIEAYPDIAHIWRPLTRAVLEGRHGLSVVARLQPGVTLKTAREELDRSAEHLRQLDPVSNVSRGLGAGDLGESVNDQRLDDLLWALLGVVGFLLLIACANVASLQLARLQQQRSELALRAALGAGRGRLLRRVLIESSLLTFAGAALGVVLASAATPALVAISPAELPRYREMGIDLRVLSFAWAVAVAGLVCFSFPPALKAAAAHPATSLKGSGRGSSSSLSAFHRGLAIVDVALALLLLAGAGLMLNSFARLLNTSPGFEAEGLYRARMVAPASRAATHQGRSSFISEVEEQLLSRPEVEAAGSTHSFPVGGMEYWLSFLLEDRPEKSPDEPELGVFQIVSPRYFEVMGLHPLMGRVLSPEDFKGRAQVVVVSRTLAEMYWPGVNPIGKRLRPARATAKDSWFSIVGVVPDQKDRGLARDVGPSVYFPQQQFVRDYTSKMDLFVRSRSGSEGLASTIRRAVREVEPNAIVYDLAPMNEVIAQTLQRERFSGILTAILAGLALTLAGAGIYGVISYGVNQRREELGIRLAMGAHAGDLKRLVVSKSLKSVMAGVVVGNGAVLVLGRLVSNQLYEIEPYDPATLAAASVFIVLTALAAGYLPARRTAKLDPTQALQR